MPHNMPRPQAQEQQERCEACGEAFTELLYVMRLKCDNSQQRHSDVVSLDLSDTQRCSARNAVTGVYSGGRCGFKNCGDNTVSLVAFQRACNYTPTGQAGVSATSQHVRRVAYGGVFNRRRPIARRLQAPPNERMRKIRRSTHSHSSHIEQCCETSARFSQSVGGWVGAGWAGAGLA